MSMFSYSDPRFRSARELRRLNLATVVKTNYISRTAEIEAVDDDTEEAIKEGYEDGYSEGQAKAELENAAARREEAKRVEQALGALARSVQAIQDAESRFRSELATAVPEAAFRLLEQMLSRELQLTSNPGREAIVRALSLDEGNGPALIRLNPTDLETLGEINDVVAGREVNLVPDLEIEPGGAVVEVGKATFDAQLGTALGRVREVLFGPDGPAGVE